MTESEVIDQMFIDCCAALIPTAEKIEQMTTPDLMRIHYYFLVKFVAHISALWQKDTHQLGQKAFLFDVFSAINREIVIQKAWDNQKAWEKMNDK